MSFHAGVTCYCQTCSFIFGCGSTRFHPLGILVEHIQWDSHLGRIPLGQFNTKQNVFILNPTFLSASLDRARASTDHIFVVSRL